MDLRYVLAKLREERAALDLAIAELERLDRNQGRPRNRDLNVVTKAPASAKKPRRRTSESGA